MEYQAFAKKFQQLHKPDWEFFRRAYLLQHCLDPSVLFPPEEQQVMKELYRTRRMEALVFQAVQYFDYLKYIVEHRAQRQMFKEVVQYSATRLDPIAVQIPGFCEEVWTEEVRQWFYGRARLRTPDLEQFRQTARPGQNGSSGRHNVLPMPRKAVEE